MWKEPEPKAGAHFTDAQVASMVRMLMRDQLDHEAVCIVARDRIVSLTAERDQLRAEVDRLREKGAANLRTCVEIGHKCHIENAEQTHSVEWMLGKLRDKIDDWKDSYRAATARAEAAEAREAAHPTAAEVIEAAEKTLEELAFTGRVTTHRRALALIARYKEAHGA